MDNDKLIAQQTLRIAQLEEQVKGYKDAFLKVYDIMFGTNFEELQPEELIAIEKD